MLGKASALLAAVALVGVSGGLVAAMGGFQQSDRAAAQGFRSERISWPAGKRQAPNLPLRDQDGRRVSPGGPHPRTAVVTFLSSSCVEQCPVLGRLLSQSWSQLRPAERPLLIVVSVDPWSDTPAGARAFVERSGWPGTWHWLMGREPALRRVWTAYGVDVRRTPQDVAHTPLAYLVDRSGYERAAYLVPFDSHDLAADARRLARE